MKTDGSVVGWGGSWHSQAEMPAGLSGVSAIAAGDGHTVVICRHTPPAIITQPSSQAVSVWQSASFGVIATGFPLYYQWRKDGLDLAGEINPAFSRQYAQTNQAGTYTVTVSNGAGSVTSAPLAFTVDPAPAPGTVVVWGSDVYQLPHDLTNVVAVAAGYHHNLALKADGTVVGWGSTSGSMVPAGLNEVVAVAASGYVNGARLDVILYGHSLALKSDGTVVGWGHGSDGIGAVLAGLSGVVAIDKGLEHSVALKSDGSVVAWSDNGFGQTNVPTAAQSGVIAIAAGPFHTVALKEDGSVVAWGQNSNGQTDVPVAAQSGVTAISAGWVHTVALKANGSVVAWGRDRPELTDVPVAAQSGVTSIAAGPGYTLALKMDGSVVAWGSESSVTKVPGGLRGVTAMAAGMDHSLALLGSAVLRPALKVRPNGNQLFLSWPSHAAGFTLQSTLSLTPPVVWSDSTEVPEVVVGQFNVTISTPDGAQWYRLRKL